MLDDEMQVVRRARALLLDEANEYEFGDYRSCACGFLYRAATGRWAAQRDTVAGPKPGTLYARTVDAVAFAVGRRSGTFGVSNAAVGKKRAGVVALFDEVLEAAGRGHEVA